MKNALFKSPRESPVALARHEIMKSPLLFALARYWKTETTIAKPCLEALFSILHTRYAGY